MFLTSMLQNGALDKIESAVSTIEQDVKFVNVDGTKWQAVISFDLANVANPVEREMLSLLLKYL